MALNGSMSANSTPLYGNLTDNELASNETSSLGTTQHVPHSGGDNFMSIAITIVCVLFSLITLLGFLGNMLVILVVTLNKSMRNSTNLLVLNLAVADLSFILICVPFTAIKYATPIWVFGDTWCRIVNHMTYVCVWASVYTLVLMCLDRLFAVVFAIKLPHIRSRRNVTISILVLWAVVFLSNIPAWMYHGVKQYPFHNETRRTCTMLTETMGPLTTKLFHITQFAFGFALPVIVIAVLYSILLTFLMKRADSVGGNAGKGLSKTKRKVTIMVILVVSVFIICWLPMQIILVLNSVGSYPQTIGNVAFQIAANCLAYMNSCMNPFLYTVSSATFRKAFKDFLCCHTCAINKKSAASGRQSQNRRRNPCSDETQITHINRECPVNRNHSTATPKQEEATPFILK